MVAVRLRVRRTEGASGGTDAWAGAIREPTDATTAVSEVAAAHVDARFETRTDPWGGAWASPSAATVEIRSRSGQRVRRLRSTRFVQILDGGKRAVVGFAASFAAAFHGGAPGNKAFGRGSAPIPARPVLPKRGRRPDLPPELRAEVMDAFREGMRRAVRALRRR